MANAYSGLYTLEDAFRLLAERCRQNELTGCLEWTKHTDRKGYGTIRIEGKYVRTHRIAYMKAFGAIPEGAHVLHGCDNPRCCEPAHLGLGSNYQNIVDKMVRDRSGKKLNIAKVKEIKTMLSHEHTHQEIADIYGVSQPTITKISLGRTWSHVTAGG